MGEVYTKEEWAYIGQELFDILEYAIVSKSARPDIPGWVLTWDDDEELFDSLLELCQCAKVNLGLEY